MSGSLIMAGTLRHSKQFVEQIHYSYDGKAHYELIPADGDRDFPSWTTWEAMNRHCQALGIGPDSWPEFEDGCDFDIPTEEIRSKNVILRAALSRRFWP